MLRRAAGDGYPISLSPSDLVSIRFTAARLRLPGRPLFLDKIKEVAVSHERLVQARHELERRGEFRQRMMLDVYETRRMGLNELRGFAKLLGFTLDEALTACIRAAFGPPPVKPTWLRDDVWKLYCEQPLTRSHPELTLETYYQALVDGKLL